MENVLLAGSASRKLGVCGRNGGIGRIRVIILIEYDIDMCMSM
jgi:hypothetical protein